MGSGLSIGGVLYPRFLAIAVTVLSLLRNRYGHRYRTGHRYVLALSPSHSPIAFGDLHWCIARFWTAASGVARRRITSTFFPRPRSLFGEHVACKCTSAQLQRHTRCRCILTHLDLDSISTAAAKTCMPARAYCTLGRVGSSSSSPVFTLPHGLMDLTGGMVQPSAPGLPSSLPTRRAASSNSPSLGLWAPLEYVPTVRVPTVL